MYVTVFLSPFTDPYSPLSMAGASAAGCSLTILFARHAAFGCLRGWAGAVCTLQLLAPHMQAEELELRLCSTAKMRILPFSTYLHRIVSFSRSYALF